eukprot:8203392-Heterocapsa_arctica.AAC.1
MQGKGPRRSHCMNWRGREKKSGRRSSAGGGKEEAGLDGKPTGRTPQLESPRNSTAPMPRES